MVINHLLTGMILQVGGATYIVPGSDFITGEFLAYNFQRGGVIFLNVRGVGLLQTLF